MSLHTSAAATLVAAAVLIATTQPAAAQHSSAQGGACDTFHRVSTVQDGARKLMAEAGGLNATAGKDVSSDWIDRIQGEARMLNTNAEKLASAPAKVDPETGFNLGKYMNGVQTLLADPKIAPARARNAALENVARQSGALAKDVSFVLANLAKLKDEAGRCSPRKAS